MKKINWENGTVTKDAYVSIDGTEYIVTPEEYEGNTPLSAENLNKMEDNIEEAINDLKNQKILWRGSWFMNDNQVITLPENISSQNSGIVLIFERFDMQNNTPLDYGYHYFFIPKIQVSLLPGKNSNFVLGSADFRYVSDKVLYIFDDRITGTNYNASSGTQSGVKYDNRYFVLSYVIGV